MATATTTTQTLVTLTLSEDEFLLIRYLVGTNRGTEGPVTKVNTALYDSIADLNLPEYRFVRNDNWNSVSIDLSHCVYDG